MSTAPTITNGIANGIATTKPSPSAISDHLRNELIRILTTGDAGAGGNGAFTIAVALVVEKFAVAAREILMTENLARNDLSSLMMTRKHPWGWPMASNVFGGIGGGIGDSLGYPLAPVNNENFGVQAIRQFVDALRTIGESPAKLVEALAVARQNNLTDVVAALEKKLGVSPTDPINEMPTPTLVDDGADERPLQ